MGKLTIQTGWNTMRRGMLVILGFGIGTIIMLCLVATVQAQLHGVEPVLYTQQDKFYPRSVMGTDLRVLRAEE